MTRSLSCLGLLAFASAAHAEDPQDLVLEDIELRPGVSVDIHLSIHDNSRVPCRSGTLLAIHGAASTAASLGPLAEAMVSQPPGGRPMCRVLTMELPGHGEGGLPTGILFGDLTIDDYATAVIATLDELRDQGIRPTTVMGHSMGGLVVQVVQDMLLEDGTSLWKAFHIRHAILLAPALPASVPWTYRDSGAGAGLVAFAVTDATLGEILSIPTALWPVVAFSTLDGSIAEGALTGEELDAAGMVGPESMAAIGGFFGLDGYDQRDVEAGIFASRHKTRLDIVAFQEDTIIQVGDLELLFPYLTEQAVTEEGFVVVEDDDASHGYPISHPDGLLDAFEGEVSLP